MLPQNLCSREGSETVHIISQAYPKIKEITRLCDGKKDYGTYYSCSERDGDLYTEEVVEAFINANVNEAN